MLAPDGCAALAHMAVQPLPIYMHASLRNGKAYATMCNYALTEKFLAGSTLQDGLMS